MIIIERVYSDTQEDIKNIAEILVKIALKLRNLNKTEDLRT